MKAHVITVKREVRKEPVFVLGRVRYHTDNPKEYEVKVVKKGEAKLLVGKKGIYVIDDKIAEELIRKTWEDYLSRGRKRKTKKKVGFVEPPVEVTEGTIRDYFSKKGIVPHLETGWINFCPELPDFRALRDRVRKIIERAKAKSEVA